MVDATARQSLRASYDLIQPSVHPALFAPDVIERLRAVTMLLPPIHRAGFECRLDEDDQRVDIQQGITGSSWETRALAAFAARGVADTASGRAWKRVNEFCLQWADSSSAVARNVAELWLEFDVQDAGVQYDNQGGESFPAPSVFAVLSPEQRTPAAFHSAALVALGQLVGATDAERLQPTLDMFSNAAAQHDGWVSHVGMMLGRKPAALRLHVSGIPGYRLAAFLTAVGWTGNVDNVMESARTLFDAVDRIVYCFDVVDIGSRVVVLPRLGLEGFFEQKVGVDPRWEPLVEQLVERGLASPQKARALLQWPGGFTPLATPDWPDDLIIRSIAKPASWFGRFERRLSHIKLFHDGDQNPVAKAYFGFGHLFGNLAGVPVVDQASKGSSRTDAKLHTAAPQRLPISNSFSANLEAAIGAAERALLASRNQGGWWRDFYDVARPHDRDARIAGYASDEWISAYVASALALSTREKAKAAAVDTWRLLSRRRGDSGGWGYHAQLPPDADSTAWSVTLSRAINAPLTSRVQSATDFIMQQTRSDGGVVTYRTEDCPAIAHFLRMDGPYDGWCTSHTCVTAAVAMLDLDPRHRTFLRAAQQPDGSWTGHWWDDDEYATAMGISALARHPNEAGNADAVQRAARWSVARLSPNGSVYSTAMQSESVFATALAVRAMTAASAEHAEVKRAVFWLMETQLADGTFTPSTRLRVPAPSQVDPLAAPATTITYLDRDGIFTLATAFAALTLAQHHVQ